MGGWIDRWDMDSSCCRLHGWGLFFFSSNGNGNRSHSIAQTLGWQQQQWGQCVTGRNISSVAVGVGVGVGLGAVAWDLPNAKRLRERQEEEADMMVESVDKAACEAEAREGLEVCLGSRQLAPYVVNRVLSKLNKPEAALYFIHWARDCPGFAHNTFTYNSLLRIYIQAGRVDEAYHILTSDLLPAGLFTPNHLTFTLLINAFCYAGQVSQAIQVFRAMQAAGMKPADKAFSALIRRLCDLNDTNKALELFNEMQQQLGGSSNNNTVLYTIVISHLCTQQQQQRWDTALAIFNHMLFSGHAPPPNAVTYSMLIHALFKAAKWELGIHVFQHMLLSGFKPRISICTSVINACCKTHRIHQALSLLHLLRHPPPPPAYSALIHALFNAGNLEAAQALFHQATAAPHAVQQHREAQYVSVYSSYITGLCKLGKLGQAMDAEKKMADAGCPPDPIPYNTLIYNLCAHKRIDDALLLMNRALATKCIPALQVCTTMVKALCNTGRVDQAYQLMETMLAAGRPPNAYIYSSIVHGLCRKNRIEEAYLLLQKMKQRGCTPHLVGYTSILNALCREDRYEQAQQLFQLMQHKGCQPDVLAFNILIRDHCRRGKVNMGLDLLRDMLSTGVQPNVVSISIVVEGLCRANRVEDARALLERINLESLPPSAKRFRTLGTPQLEAHLNPRQSS